jgi:CBS domain-containing protein
MKVREIMTPAIAIDASTTISHFVNHYAFRYRHRVYPVVELDRFIGLIDVRSIKGLPATEWPTTKIGAFLSDPSTYCTLDPDTAATEGLRRILANNCAIAPVVRRDTLFGILTRSDVLRVIELKRDMAA